MAAKNRTRQPKLNASQLKTFSEALLLIHSPLDLDSIPQAVLAAMEMLLPGDCYAYNEFHGNRVLNISLPDPLDAESISAFQTYLGEHPSVNHIMQTHTTDAVRLSDMSSHQKWRATNLYNHVFRPSNLKYQVGCMFPIALGSMAGFSVNRVSSDFTAGQRDLMTLLVPHFAQAWTRANAIFQRDASLAWVAIAEVDSRGRILFATDKALAFIASYRSRASVSPRELPEPYRGWLFRNIHAAKVLDAFEPLHLKTSVHQLTVRLACMPGQDRYQLHFNEKIIVTPSQVASHLGLTPRQGEVLHWIAEGKSNEEIGLILGAKLRTITKHVEQIFARIGVENRSSATRLWYECVAALQG
jgi:DNA-binding CsgD family transcriptional regulator